jgi:hypothetical protein
MSLSLSMKARVGQVMFLQQHTSLKHYQEWLTVRIFLPVHWYSRWMNCYLMMNLNWVDWWW